MAFNIFETIFLFELVESSLSTIRTLSLIIAV